MKFELDLEKDAFLDLLSGMQPHKLDELLQTNGHLLGEFSEKEIKELFVPIGELHDQPFRVDVSKDMFSVGLHLENDAVIHAYDLRPPEYHQGVKALALDLLEWKKESMGRNEKFDPVEAYDDFYSKLEKAGVLEQDVEIYAEDTVYAEFVDKIDKHHTWEVGGDWGRIYSPEAGSFHQVSIFQFEDKLYEIDGIGIGNFKFIENGVENSEMAELSVESYHELKVNNKEAFDGLIEKFAEQFSKLEQQLVELQNKSKVKIDKVLEVKYPQCRVDIGGMETSQFMDSVDFVKNIKNSDLDGISKVDFIEMALEEAEGFAYHNEIGVGSSGYESFRKEYEAMEAALSELGVFSERTVKEVISSKLVEAFYGEPAKFNGTHPFYGVHHETGEFMEGFYDYNNKHHNKYFLKGAEHGISFKEKFLTTNRKNEVVFDEKKISSEAKQRIQKIDPGMVLSKKRDNQISI